MLDRGPVSGADVPAPRLVRVPAAQPTPAADDPAVRSIRSAVATGGPHRILGAAGTGKTTLLVTLAADAVADGLDPHRVLLLTPTRAAAARLRDRMAAQAAGLPATPRVQSVHGYAFSVLRRAAALTGEEPPRLLDAAEQDLILAELLAGHAAGEGRAVVWPGGFADAVGTGGFRSALLDLFAQVTARGFGPDELADAGDRWAEPAWVAAAAILEEYQQVIALRSPGALDPVALVRRAADLLATQPRLALVERDAVRIVLVDDYQDVDPAAERLLSALTGPGSTLVVAGDPDAGVSAFRGGDHDLLRVFCDRFPAYGDHGDRPAPTHLLTRPLRAAPALRQLAGQVATRLPGRGATRQTWREPPAPDERPGCVAARVFRSRAAQAADVAARLRTAHLRDGLAWARMAVIARTTGQVRFLRRALAGAGVPLDAPADGVPLREEPAVVPLLTALALSLDPHGADPSLVVGLLGSPIGGADALAVRRLRQALLAQERATGGVRPSDELLVAAVGDPALLTALPSPVSAPARRVAAVLRAGHLAADAPGADAQTVLWALWQAAGLETGWRAQALRGGPAGLRADRGLDAVLALFDAAARFVDRMPGAGPRQFLDHVHGAGLPADTRAAQAVTGDTVTVLTPHAAAGGEWDLVVIVGVQEGVWPDLRPRHGLLRAQRLEEVLAGRADTPLDEAHLRRQEETRLFYVAVTRAREQVWVTAVSTEDEAPSDLLDLVGGPPADATAGRAGDAAGVDDPERPVDEPAPPMELSALVAALRTAVCTSGSAGDPGGVAHPAARAEAARLLARLARAGVPGADPADWAGLAPLSDPGPLADADAPVVVSPSRVETFARCPLRWLLETSGGRAGDAAQARVGSLVHAVAAAHPHADRAELRAELARVWPRLRLPDSWVARATWARAERMVDKLAAYHEQAAREGRRLVGTEVAFQADVDLDPGEVPTGEPAPGGQPGGAGDGRRRVQVAGRVDRLERDGRGRLVVVDLKTGRTKPTRAEVAAHPQLGVYQVAVASGAFDGVTPGSWQPGGAVLVPLGDTAREVTPQHQPPLTDAADPGWAHDLVLSAASGMAGADFPATAGPLCRHCPVRRSCPLGRAGVAST